MTPPSLTPEQEEALIEALAQALEDMVDRSCPDMAPLWLAASRSARELLNAPIPELGFTPSPALAAMKAPSHSKYRALATFRHALLWRAALERVEDDDFRRAVEAIYLTPYPDNTPPYAWSRSAARAPGIAAFPSASMLKEWAKEGCWQATLALRAEESALYADGSFHAELQAMLLGPAVGGSARDVLKLEDHDV
ncbi:MAG: hypothetical protein H6741_25750 [Alphaproteobacteria bacterium]|nr:hypothetical protein [Alphaproteobacteria bacterium]MCB9796116.1 hypothetical protein [Alphaproteobacteria bacterium]